ncbi:helix-turn-helix domain-containing protein [Microbispora bryophytorum]|uniref:helix-turn-helix domain-containing protein n=1 Tax=Microbispora bryophytorum TaxID=1460882 RepID=UPI0033F08060
MDADSTRRSFTDLASNLRGWRKRRGLTQPELARASGVSASYISKIETGQHVDVRIETVRKLAVVLRVQTTTLMGKRGDAEAAPMSGAVLPAEVWEPTRRALVGQYGQPDEEPTVAGVTAALDGMKPSLAANRYGDVAQVLPALIRDAEALNGAGRGVLSQVLNTAGWTLTQTRQFTLAEPTLRQALDMADDRLDAAAAVNTLVWLYLRQGKLDHARVLATQWADDIEPRMSRATVRELTMWGRLLLGITNAAVRDNRPGEAEDTLRLAASAATAIGREVESDSSTTRTFGPVTVAMIRAESATIQDRPDETLRIAARIPSSGVLHAISASRNRHRLDVAAALVSTRRVPEAVTVMAELAAHSPQWLAQQRYARDTLTRVLRRRRTLTMEMRNLANLMGMAH